MIRMSVETKLTLEWKESTPGEWRWLTFGHLCEIADKGRDDGIDEAGFVYFHPEHQDSPLLVRADLVRIDPDGASQ